MQGGGGDNGEASNPDSGDDCARRAGGWHDAGAAGGLAIREQSAWGEGASYAGVAAGGSVSAMFWNPATTTQDGKFALENSVSMIFPETTQTGTNNLPRRPPINDGIPNSSVPAVAVAGYTSMRLNDRLWLGFSLNSPFGLSVGFQNPNWAGAFYGESSTLKTYNASPSVAYKLAEWISVGAGFQAQYAHSQSQDRHRRSRRRFSSPNVNLAQLTGDGWGFGWTAGVTVTPTPWTKIGLGYRSAVNQSINGDLETNGSAGRPARFPRRSSCPIPRVSASAKASCRGLRRSAQRNGPGGSVSAHRLSPAERSSRPCAVRRSGDGSVPVE